jgi:LysR family transcriptional regulator, regulator of gene expression of beta-lactamase
MVQAAMAGAGAALAPAAMFHRELASGRLVQPFVTEVDAGRYWLTRSLGRKPSQVFEVLKEWLMGGPAGAAAVSGCAPGASGRSES